MLLLDGHKSRVSLQAADYGRKNNVEILLFPAHTTHLLQPLDVAVFKGFKERYRTAIKQFYEEERGTISRYHLGRLTKESFEGISKESVVNGFRTCGLLPFSEEAVLSKICNSPETGEKRGRRKRENCQKEAAEWEWKEGETEPAGKDEVGKGRKKDIRTRLDMLEKNQARLSLENRELRRKIAQLEKDESNGGKKKSRLSGEGLVLTNEETNSMLTKAEEQKREKIEEMKRKKEESQEKRKKQEEEREKKRTEKEIRQWEQCLEQAPSIGNSFSRSIERNKPPPSRVEAYLDKIKTHRPFPKFTENTCCPEDVADPVQLW